MAPPKVYKHVDQTRYFLPIEEKRINNQEGRVYIRGVCIVLKADGSFYMYSVGIDSEKLTMDFEIPDALRPLIEKMSDDIIDMKDQGKTLSEISDAILLKYLPRLRF